MTVSPATAPVSNIRKKRTWLWLTLCSVAALSAGGWIMRKELAAELVRVWLRGQGASADIRFDQLSLTHLSGRASFGREASIRRIEADYSLSLPFSGHSVVSLTRVRLVHPVGQISYRNGKLGFGALDTLIQSALSAKPSGAPPPREILVEDADIGVASDYGRVRMRGGLTLKDGRLTDMHIQMPESRLEGTLGEGEAVSGVVTARSVKTAANGDQLQIQARFTADSIDVRPDPMSPVNADHQKTHLQGVVLTLDSWLPYGASPSLAQTFSGPARADIGLKAEGFQGQAAYIDGLEGVLRLDGQLGATAAGLQYRGPARLVTQIEHLETGTLDSQDIGLIAPDLQLLAIWDVTKGGSATLEGPVTGHLGLLRQGDLFVKDASLALDRIALKGDGAGGDLAFDGHLVTQRLAAGDLSFEQSRTALTGEGHLTTATSAFNLTVSSDISSDRGQYLGLDAMAAARKPDKVGRNAGPVDGIYALNQALQRFSVRARGRYTLSGQTGGASRFELQLQNPAVIALAGGGRLVIAPTERPVLVSHAAGGFAIALEGPDLPKVALKVDQFGFDPQNPFVLSGLYNLTAAFDIDPLTGAVADAKGRFTLTDQQAFLVTLDGPGHLRARAAELGDHLENVSLDLSQGQGPFFRYDTAGWHVSGHFDNLSLLAPSEALNFKAARGPFEAFAIPRHEGAGLKANLVQGEVSDATQATGLRLNPLLISGTLTQDAQALTGRFTAFTPRQVTAGKPLAIAAIDLDNTLATGQGSLNFRTLDLTFAPKGLQPGDLSPLVDDIMHRYVSGQVAFTGGFNWGPKGSHSGGVMSTDSLGFTTASGVLIAGLKTRITFDSLAPLTTGTGQAVHIDNAQLSTVGFNDLNFAIQVTPDHLAVEQAVLQSVGGPVTLEPMIVPFDAHVPISGVVTFNGLDFGQVVAATDLKNSLSFEGRLSGRIPFRFENAQLSVAQGVMTSDAPGRIAIKRADLTTVTATGNLTAAIPEKGGAGQAAVAVDPAFNPFQDLAFQAMEHITFDKIDAKMNSAPNGVLETTFHIKGYYDPPEPQKATVGIVDYLSGKWMTKPIKLPSKTPIELYLDVPLRLDGVLSDLLSKTSAPPVSTSADNNK